MRIRRVSTVVNAVILRIERKPLTEAERKIYNDGNGKRSPTGSGKRGEEKHGMTVIFTR